jgi:hypothetical protein
MIEGYVFFRIAGLIFLLAGVFDQRAKRRMDQNR